MLKLAAQPLIAAGPQAAEMPPEDQWKCGQNCPLVYRGQHGEVCRKLRMVIANLLWNFHDKQELRAHISRTFSASGDTAHNTKAFHVVARLTGLPPKTVFAIEVDMIRQG